MVSSVRRSHFEDVSERYRVCATAVFRMKGVLGRRKRSMAEGEDSIVAVLCVRAGDVASDVVVLKASRTRLNAGRKGIESRGKKGMKRRLKRKMREPLSGKASAGLFRSQVDRDL